VWLEGVLGRKVPRVRDARDIGIPLAFLVGKSAELESPVM
jgi:hypothetical protein